MTYEIHPDPVPLLQALIRFDTTNPPGDEAGAVAWAHELLSSVGISCSILARDPGRPNLVARLPGRGQSPPLLLYGHLDVVNVRDQIWQRAPFGGEVQDDHVWGRGALDMKSGVAMYLSACLRARAENAALQGDILLALVADEEQGGDYGARFLVEEHPGFFKDVRYALGEFGGFTYHFGGQRLYPIMVSEKQICHTRAIIRGPAGHGSLDWRGGTMARLAEFLQVLDRRRLPVHITPELRLMIENLAGALPAPYRQAVPQILNPALTDLILDRLGKVGQVFEPLVRNTATPTMIQGGEQINVIPCEIHVGLDGRLLPGFQPEDLLAELRVLAGEDVEFVVERHDPGPANPDMAFFSTLSEVLRQADPGGCPIPLLLAGVTDARFFSRLGIQTYGFTPMKLPPEFEFTRLVHAADERIPVDALRFGAEAVYQALLAYGSS